MVPLLRQLLQGLRQLGLDAPDHCLLAEWLEDQCWEPWLLVEVWAEMDLPGGNPFSSEISFWEIF